MFMKLIAYDYFRVLKMKGNLKLLKSKNLGLNDDMMDQIWANLGKFG